MSNTIQKEDVQTHWTKVAQSVLLGRTITEVRYLNDEEMEMMGWLQMCSNDSGRDTT